MINDAIHDFIVARKHLVWYAKDHRALNEEAIVEATLNYGNWDDVQELIRVLGIKRVAEIFRANAFRQRTNYRRQVRHYFNLYFNKYVHMAQ